MKLKKKIQKLRYNFHTKVGLTTSTQIFGDVMYSPPSNDHDYASPKHQAAAVSDGLDSFDAQPNASVQEYFQVCIA
jgi:hypothetical protein